MSSIEMANDGELSLQMGADGKPQLLLKGAGGEEQPFPQPIDEGKVELVHRHDHDAIQAGKLAAAQNGMVFTVVVFGFKVVFHHGSFFHLLIVAKDTDRHLKLVFTIVENVVKPVVLLFTPLKKSSSETLQLENDEELSLPVGGDPFGKVQYADPRDPRVIEAAKFAAMKNGVEFAGVILGFQVVFSFMTFYSLLMVGKDSQGDNKLFFTVVTSPPRQEALLFTPVNLPFSETLQLGKNEQLSLPMEASKDGKVFFVYPGDPNVEGAAKFAANQNGVGFLHVVLGFKVVFFHETFYHLLLAGKDHDGHTKLFFTIVAAVNSYKPVVLLFKPVKSPFHLSF